MSERKANGVAEFRYKIGAEILEKMDKENDLPLPNIFRLSKVMQEYFVEEGFADELKQSKFKWRPTVDYWRSHIGDIAEGLRKKKKKFFIFRREWGSFSGTWQFVKKEEYEIAMKRDYADIGTRVTTFNDKLLDGQKRWQLELPSIAQLPLLTN